MTRRIAIALVLATMIGLSSPAAAADLKPTAAAAHRHAGYRLVAYPELRPPRYIPASAIVACRTCPR